MSLRVAHVLQASGASVCSVIVPAEGPLSEQLRRQGLPYYTIPVSSYSLGAKRPVDFARFGADLVRMSARFARLVGRAKPDLLYIGGTRALVVGAILGQVFHVPVVWHIHSLFSDTRVLAALRCAGGLPSVKRIICVSRTVRDQYPSLLTKAQVLYNGVDLDVFARVERNSLVEHFGLSPSVPLVLFIGTLQPSKRQDVFIKSLRYVLRDVRAVKGFIVGGAREETEKYKEYLKGLSIRLDLGETLAFAGHRDDIPEILYGASAVVLGMAEEACPLVVFEAGAAGVPVVGPDVGGAAELIRASGAGLLYRYGDERDLARQLVRMLRDTALCQALGRQGREFAHQHRMERFDGSIRHTMKEVLGHALHSKRT